jgi:lipopolysaccharide transport system ATP-binding protein
MNSDIILKVEDVGKQYRLGIVGTGTISHDLNRWWNKVRGKEDPYLKVGEANIRSEKGSSEYVWAIKNINFEVKRGEVLGIIGKNGAGKSTLLKILSRVTSPTTGEIKTKGRIASLLEVGTGFHPEMTGKENIYLNGAILGMTKAEINAKIDEIIDFSGCLRYVDTPVKRYSSGMRVRLAFAVAAFLEPDILVVDEVLAVGDAEFQKKAIGKMQDISNTDGRTVLFVSHNMVAVKDLCNRGILLENGLITYRGHIGDVVDKYLSSDESTTLKKVFSEATRRSGSQKLMIQIEIITGNDEIITNEDLLFRLTFKKTKTNELTLGYVIKDDKGVNVHAANMQQYNLKYRLGKGSNIDILLKKIPLAPGKYALSLYLGNGSFDVDIIEDAMFFQVFWSKDIKAIPPIKKWGSTFIKTEWNYNNE